MSTVSEQIVSNSNYTSMQKASQETTTSTTVSGDDFLYLMTEQLKYQDPTDPVDTNDMLAQEAQFQSLTELESLSSNFSKFTNMFQASSLIGQEVEVSVSDDKTITGTVEYVDFSDSSGASVSVNGTMYPLTSITKMYPQTQNEQNESSVVTNVTETLLQGISDNIGTISTKLGKYLDNIL